MEEITIENIDKVVTICNMPTSDPIQSLYF